MAEVPYESRSNWSWGEELATPESSEEEDIHLPGMFEGEEPAEETPAQDIPAADTNKTNNNTRPQRNYRPRTCRICLEVVLPSFEPAPEGVPSMFNPAPKVQYISEEAESGRLISPCKCTGTGRYVHEGCLQQWRNADKRFGRRNYWECPTCKFKYRLERMRWGRWVSSTSLQIFLTVAIMFTAVFIFGFIADPIINLYLDPYDTITSLPSGGLTGTAELDSDWEDMDSWAVHFIKGLASLGLLGFVKAFFAMSPWHWWNLRQSGVLGGGGRGRRGTGRDRLENISWTLVIIGIATFLYAVWKFVRGWTRRTLEMASESVMDVQSGDDDYDEIPAEVPSTADDGAGTAVPATEAPNAGDPETESRKTQ